jgi:hypothetical protein
MIAIVLTFVFAAAAQDLMSEIAPATAATHFVVESQTRNLLARSEQTDGDMVDARPQADDGMVVESETRNLLGRPQVDGDLSEVEGEDRNLSDEFDGEDRNLSDLADQVGSEYDSDFMYGPDLDERDLAMDDEISRELASDCAHEDDIVAEFHGDRELEETESEEFILFA